MVFHYRNKFFIPLTIHIELKEVVKSFKNSKMIISKINSLLNMLINDFKIKKPKLLISGINPHAGENGLISTDEIKYLNPIINKLKNKNIDITGPVSGDGMINEINLLPLSLVRLKLMLLTKFLESFEIF